MSAELGLAIFAAVEACIKYGKELQSFCAALRHAETEINERILRIESSWQRCIIQLNFIRKMQHMMDESHLELHEQMLHHLVGKLEVANAKLSRLVKREPCQYDISRVTLVPKKLKYAFKKESLDEAISLLESWQRLSDPSWFLVLRMADQQLDAELAGGSSTTAKSIPSVLAIRAAKEENVPGNNRTSGVSLPAAALSQMNISRIRFSDAKLAKAADLTEKKAYILDSIISHEAPSYYTMKGAIRDLVRRLRHSEPENFGLLICKGFITEKTLADAGYNTFTLVFRTPQEMTELRSLRDYLINVRDLGSLSHRFDIARQLANSISYVHTYGFVHKNVRPETILLLSSPEKVVPSLFLVGFDYFRREEGKTQRLGDTSFEKNLYRHASRQGLRPECDYIMQHDIYSLGVCLLEIGLWCSFSEYDSQDQNPKPSGSLHRLSDASTEQVSQYLQTSAKNDFLDMARTQLPRCMGTQYAEVVETCLTCLDPDNADFGDETEFEDEDGILVGVRYIQKVLHRLNALYV